MAPIPLEAFFICAFFTTTLEAFVSNLTVAPDVFVFDRVRSREVVPAFDPSRMTLDAPLKVISEVAFAPEKVGLIPTAGLIVSVLVALLPVDAPMVMG